MSADPAAAALAERALAGERRAIARLLTVFDDDAPGAAQAAARLAAQAGHARVVGVTGVPGSGKSTLVNALLGAWLERGLQVGVLAFDPSSPISGGAVLGDRIRMGEHGAHPNAFVRSFSARGELGGLSRAAGLAGQTRRRRCGAGRIVVEEGQQPGDRPPLAGEHTLGEGLGRPVAAHAVRRTRAAGRSRGRGAAGRRSPRC